MRAYTRCKYLATHSYCLDIARVQDIVGEDTPLVVTISMMVAAMFDLSKELGKRLETTQFTTGNVNLKVKALDGQIPMIRVGSGRMKLNMSFLTDALHRMVLKVIHHQIRRGAEIIVS